MYAQASLRQAIMYAMTIDNILLVIIIKKSNEKKRLK